MIFLKRLFYFYLLTYFRSYANSDYRLTACYLIAYFITEQRSTIELNDDFEASFYYNVQAPSANSTSTSINFGNMLGITRSPWQNANGNFFGQAITPA